MTLILFYQRSHTMHYQNALVQSRHGINVAKCLFTSLFVICSLSTYKSN